MGVAIMSALLNLGAIGGIVQGAIQTLTPGTTGLTPDQTAFFNNNVGTVLPDRAQYTSFAATASTAPKISAILQFVNFESNDMMVTGSSCRVQVAKFAAGTNLLDTSPVTFYANGNTVAVSAMTPGSFTAWGGATRKFPMYEIDLLSPDPVNGGYVDLYASWSPTPDMAAAGMVPRVIGPLRIYCKPAGYDRTIVVDINQPVDTSNEFAVKVQKLSQALNYVAGKSTWNGYHVLIKHMQPGATIDFYSETFANNIGTMNNRRGMVVVDGGNNLNLTSGVGLSPVSSGLTDSTNVIRPYAFMFTGLKLINAKVDLSRCLAYLRATQGATSENRWYSSQNVDFYGAGSDFNYLPGYDGLGMNDVSKIFWGGSNAFVACQFRDGRLGDMSSFHVVGCRFSHYIGDQNQPSTDTFGLNNGKTWPLLFLMNDSYDANGTPLTDADANIQLSYSGAAGDVATWTVSGQHASSTRQLQLLVNGSVKATYLTAYCNTGQDVATARTNNKCVSVSDLVAAINAQTGTTGWSAVALGNPTFYNRLQVAYLIGFSQGRFSLPPNSTFTADVTVNPYLTCVLALHVDNFQFGGGYHDNALIGSYYAIRGNYNTLTAGNLLKANCAYINVAIDVQRDDAGSSSHTDYGNLSGTSYHNIIAHCTFPTSTNFGDNTANSLDSFCRFLNNYSGNLGFGSALSAQAQVRNNVQWWGVAPQNAQTPVPAADSSNKLIQQGVNPQAPNYYNIVDFPKMREGLSPDFVVGGVTYTMTHTKGTWDKPDFTPVPTGNLRKAAFMAPPCVPFDIEGRPRNLTLDWVGAVGMTAAT